MPPKSTPPTATNGNAAQSGLEVATTLETSTLSVQELSEAFSYVSWMEFNVTARPNLKAFAAHPAVRQVISQVTQGTLNDIKDAITANVMRSINEIVERAVRDATSEVPKHVMNNMTKTFGALSIASTATPFTEFQHLRSENTEVNNRLFDITNSFNGGMGSGNNINSGNDIRDSGNTNSNNNNNNNNNNNPVGFPPTPGADAPFGVPRIGPQPTPGFVPGTPGFVPGGSPGLVPGVVIPGVIPGPGPEVVPIGVPGSIPGVVVPGGVPGIVPGVIPGIVPVPLDPRGPALSTTTPDIGTAKWIWTPEQPFNVPPPGPRAFRKVVIIPQGSLVDSMVIDITCDNFYTLYVNGFVVGNGLNWQKVQRYSIKLPKTNKVIIAVYATNDPVSLAQAGLIASSVMWDSTNYNGSNAFKEGTDSSWMCSITASTNGFQRLNYKPDNSWVPVRVEGDYGMAPWGPVPKPTSTDPVTGGFSGVPNIPNPPDATRATPGPNADGSTSL